MLKKIICFMTVITILLSLAACQTPPAVVKRTPVTHYITREPSPSAPTETPTASPVAVRPKPPKVIQTAKPIPTPVPGPDWSPDFPVKPATHMILKVLTNAPNALDSSLNKEYVQIFQDAFNVEFQLVDMKTLSDLMTADQLTADQLPDIIPAQIASTFYDKLKDSKLIREIPNTILSKYPALVNMVNTHDATVAFREFEGGKLYGIPRLQAYPTNRNYDTTSLAVRKDWLNNVGITKAPETVDELSAMFTTFTNGDPDKNGKKDTYGIGGKLEAAFFTPFTGTRLLDWVKDDTTGNYVPTYMSSKMSAPLKYYAQQFQNGSFFFTTAGTSFKDNDPGNMFNRTVTGDTAYRAGIISVDAKEEDLFVDLSANFKYKGENLTDMTKPSYSINVYRAAGSAYGAAITASPTAPPTPTPVSKNTPLRTPKPPRRPTPTRSATPTPTLAPTPTAVPPVTPERTDFAFKDYDTKIGDVVELLPPLKLSSGVAAKIPYVPSTDCTIFNINVSDEKLDRIFLMYNYILVGKGSDIVTYGIYDKDWYASDGEAFVKSVQGLAGRPNYAWDLYGVIKGLNGNPDVYVGCQDIFTYASYYPKAFTPLFSNSGDKTIAQMSKKQDELLNASYKEMSSNTILKSIIINYIANKTIQDIIDAKNKPYNDAVAAYKASGYEAKLTNAIELEKTSPEKAHFMELKADYDYRIHMDYLDAQTDKLDTEYFLGLDPTNAVLIKARDDAITAFNNAKAIDDEAKIVWKAADVTYQKPLKDVQALAKPYIVAKDAAKKIKDEEAPYVDLLKEDSLMSTISNAIFSAGTSTPDGKVFSITNDGVSKIVDQYNTTMAKNPTLQEIITKVNTYIKNSKYLK